MRIGLFTDTYPPQINGVSVSVKMLKEALEKQGHTVYVVTANNESAFKYNYDEKNRVLKVPAIEVGIYDYRLSRIYPAQVIKMIRSWKLEIIHSHQEFSIGIMARLLAKEFKIPVVHTFHTLYEENIYYITKGHFDKVSREFVRKTIKTFLDKTCNQVIVPTDKVYKMLKDEYKVQKDIHIIPTGIAIDRFFKENVDQKYVEKLKAKYNIKKNDFLIISVGRVAIEKSFDFLIKAMPKLIEKHPNIKLMIVGDGPAREDIDKLIKEQKVEDNVIMTGKAMWDDMPYYYAAADVFATASTSETQGLTIVEAMAANLVPICIDDEAWTAQITDNISGIIFHNEKEYIDDIIKVYKDKKLKETLSVQAKERANEFGSDMYATRVLKVYEKTLEEFKKNNRGILSSITERIRGIKDDTSTKQ